MDVLAPLVTSLHNDGRVRVWSLVITILGDAVHHRGGRIPTLRLQHLLERIAVEPGALRTALSRLARDGWVTRDRSGRHSFYRLSARGQAELQTALPLVYAPPRTAPPQSWTLASGPTPPQNAISVGPDLWLIPDAITPPTSQHLWVTGTLHNLPDQAARRAVTPDHQRALQSLFSDLDAQHPDHLSPLDAMVARTLLIHRWRRLILRFGDVPPQLFPKSLPPFDPRNRVAALYARLLPASERWLDTPLAGHPALPAADPRLAQRFRP